MKKIILGVVFVVGVVAAVQAQPRAIGGRLGYGIEASYQHSFGSNMLQADLGLPGFHSIAGTVTYDWIWSIDSWKEKGEWNWYAGVGGGAGFSWWGNWAFLGVAGMVGVEYNFWFPLQLSLDYRPLIGPHFGGGGAGFYHWGLWDFALSVRYKF